MQVTPLKIDGAWHFEPVSHRDERGSFLEIFKQDVFTEHVGHPFEPRQTNCSVSVAGALRGVHFSDVPPGQAKYVTCVRGAILDVVVDVRVGSPTFGQWDGRLLDEETRGALYVAEGLGHGFMALTDHTTVVYGCSTAYAPGREHGIHPLDPELNIAWPTEGRNGAALVPILSAKDQQMPSLAEARDAGLLPTLEAANAARPEK